MPTTLADIARALGVSKMTVSRAINDRSEISRETRARVLEAARRMNYRPNQFARALTTNRSYLLGVVVPDLMHSYFAEICRGVEGLARPLGYQNVICSTGEDAANEQREVEAIRIPEDVAIVVGGNIHYGDMLKVPLTTVAWSTLEMGQAAARLLIELVEGKKRRREQRIIVEPKLIVRESCGAAKAILV